MNFILDFKSKVICGQCIISVLRLIHTHSTFIVDHVVDDRCWQGFVACDSLFCPQFARQTCTWDSFS